MDQYIIVDTFPTENTALNAYLTEHKTELIDRKIRKFTENNWFEWGALRNYNRVTDKLGEDCIYVRMLTRDTEVAFVDKLSYFGGGLIALIPKADVSHKPDLSKTVALLNSKEFRENYLYSGRFKIGQRQLCKSLINRSILE